MRGLPPDRRRWISAPLVLRCRSQRGQDRQDDGRILVIVELPIAVCGQPAVADPGHSGMFPCFFGGKACRFSASIRSALPIAALVAEGLITWST